MQPKERIENYFSAIHPVIAASGSATPSGIFELNTSRRPRFAQWIIGGAPQTRSSQAAATWSLFRASLREFTKWTLISLMARLLYRRRAVHRRALLHAQHVFIGFVTKRNTRLVAKDFDGFRECLPGNAPKLSIGLRLPFLGMRDYLRGDQDVLPVMAHVSLSDVAAAIARQLKLARAVMSDRTLDAHIRDTCLQDIQSGHAVASQLIGTTVAKLAKKTPANARLYFPMERHDWEQLALTALQRVRHTEAVQNCTFSPLDLNMYRCPTYGPAYRHAQPDRLHAIDSHWARVFRDELGLDCQIDIAPRNRFTGNRFKLELDGHSPSLLYLASINHDKLKRDLAVLATLADRCSVEVRLHPSLAQLVLPHGIKQSKTLADNYGWCVFADTSMVFQLDCDHSRLLFIEHPDIPTQDPTAWFPDFGARRIRADALQKTIVAPEAQSHSAVA